ncbi:apicoplast import protein Tic20, putative [Hepatocystis sp. ex Piliocolobus tephrosceles]|nr:apicoplast import protein Tic20, putative [Hepatocystis sp. ex Piliocolobus tephrosceles]
MVKFLNSCILICFLFILNFTFCFKIYTVQPIYNKKKNELKSLITFNNQKNNKRGGSKLFFTLTKYKNTNKCIRTYKINESLKKKINLIFHGESNITISDKLIASTGYILPFIDAIQAFTMPLLNILPNSMHKYVLLAERINHILSSIPFLSFGTFTGLYFLFVKENKFKFHYFIKFHHMQSLILSMFGYALALFYFRVFPYSYNNTDIINFTFLYSTMAIYFGSLIIPFIASLLGYYIEMPVISEAIKLHIGEKKNKRNDEDTIVS